MGVRRMLDDTSDRRPRYIRPKAPGTLTKPERTALLTEYFEYYRSVATESTDLLNQKLSRDVFKDVLDTIGGLLLAHAAELAARTGPVHDFIESNGLPPSLSDLLPAEFRAFCLTLNALKQWVAAEQQATDRYLLGGNARAELRAIAGSCIMTGKPLEDGYELHHPLRDGRPPIPLCHEAHDRLEKQESSAETGDPISKIILGIRAKRNNSWKNLRRGCLDLMGEQVEHSTPAVRAGARSFAREVSKTTGLSYGQIIEWLGVRGDNAHGSESTRAMKS